MTRLLVFISVPVLLIFLPPTVLTQQQEPLPQCIQYPLSSSSSSSSPPPPRCSTTLLNSCHYVNTTDTSIIEDQLGDILTQLDPAVDSGIIQRDCLGSFLSLYCLQVYRVCGQVLGGVFVSRGSGVCMEDCVRVVSEECGEGEWRYLTDLVTQLRGAGGLTLPPLLQLSQCSNTANQDCVSIFAPSSPEECVITSAPPTSTPPPSSPLATSAIIGICIGIIAFLSMVTILALIIYFSASRKRITPTLVGGGGGGGVGGVSSPNMGLKEITLDTIAQGEKKDAHQGNDLPQQAPATLMLRPSVVHEALLDINLSPRTTTMAIRIKTNSFLSLSPKQRLAHLEYPRGNICLVRDLWETDIGPVYAGEASGLYQDESLTSVFIKSLRNSASAKQRQQFAIEMTWASGFSHPNIITLLGVCTREVPHYMIFEYLEYGSLKEFLQTVGDAWFDFDQFLGDAESENFENSSEVPSQSVFGVEDLTAMACQVASGMDYLAKKAFVLKDLAARNCQVGHNMTIKIANFGLSYDRRSEEYCSIKSHKSTPVPLRWLAPESICHNKISVYSDIWSFGVLLWEIFSFGARPYSDLSNAEVVRDVLSGRVLSCPDRCPQDIYDLMLKCWNLSPNKRPWFSSILSELIQVPKRMGSKGMKSFGGAPPTPELVRALRTSMSSSEKQ